MTDWMLRYWRLRLRLARVAHRSGSTGNEWRCRLAEWLHASYRHGNEAAALDVDRLDAVRGWLADPRWPQFGPGIGHGPRMVGPPVTTLHTFAWDYALALLVVAVVVVNFALGRLR